MTMRGTAMRGKMMRKLLIVAALMPSPVLATSGFYLGRFGEWILNTDPPMLPPATDPWPLPMRYSAAGNFGGIGVQIAFERQGAQISSHYSRRCSATEEITVETGKTRALALKIDAILARQFAYVSRCTEWPRDAALPKPEMSDGLEAMLQTLEDWRIKTRDPA
jgi:hypothetical protein